MIQAKDCRENITAEKTLILAGFTFAHKNNLFPSVLISKTQIIIIFLTDSLK